MKLTAPIKLICSKEQKQHILETLELSNKACNYISEQAWSNKTFSQFRLHQLVYYDVKTRFKLSAQMIIRCIAKVADAYKLDRKRKRTFRKHAAQPYDARIFKMNDEQVSIKTIYSREKIPYVAGKHQKKLLAFRKGEVDLMYLRGNLYLACTCEVQEEAQKKTSNILGIDLGIVNIAVDSEGTHYSGRDIEIRRKTYLNRRKNLQKKGTKPATRKLKEISGRQARYQKDTNHCISKAIVATAERLSCAIALENLKGIPRTKARKSQRATMSNWANHQLRNFITYKALLAGVPVIMVDPRNTSRTCPRCTFISKNNRVTRDNFCCKQCSFSGPADLVASWNIRDKAAVNQPMVAEMICA